MAGPRLLGPRLLRQITRPAIAGQARSLHMTGAATAPRTPTSDRSPQAPATPSPDSQSTSKSTGRHFNTSRELKHVNDSSTIDFTYLPHFSTPSLAQDTENVMPAFQVPILPSAMHKYQATPASSANYASLLAIDRQDAEINTDTPRPLDGPIITTVAHESTHINTPSAMVDVHDGAEHASTDFHEVVETLESGKGKMEETVQAVRDAARKVAVGVEREASEARESKGLFKQVWTGLVEDVLGSGRSKA